MSGHGRRVLLLVATLLAAYRPTVAQTCTFTGISKFEPPQSGYPAKFAPGFTTSLVLYGPPSARKLLVPQNFGVSIFQLTDPDAPALAGFLDIEETLPREPGATGTVAGVAAARDGSRLLVAYGRSPNGTLLLRPTFAYAGDFGPPVPTGGTAILQNGSRYLGFSLLKTGLSVADITTFGSGTAAGSIPHEFVANAPGGARMKTEGSHVVYLSGPNVVIVNAASIGPIGQLSSGFRVSAHAPASLGLAGGEFASVATALHPLTGDLYLLLEGKVGALSSGFALARTRNGGETLERVGQIVAPPGFGFPRTTPATSALIPTGDTLMALFFGRTDPGGITLNAMYLNRWGFNWAPPFGSLGEPDLSFSPGPAALTAFSAEPSAGGQRTIHMYAGTGTAGYAFSMSCSGEGTVRGPARFYTISPPCRLIDTRETSPLAPNEGREFIVSGSCAVRPGDGSLALNVTALNATQAGHLSAVPALVEAPVTRTVSFQPGRAFASNAIVETWPGSINDLRIKVFNQSAGTVDVILDVSGSFR